jgi:hypothetical protein
MVKIGSIGGDNFRPAFNEVDLVGWVLWVGEPKPADFQSVYICDRKGFSQSDFSMLTCCGAGSVGITI